MSTSEDFTVNKSMFDLFRSEIETQTDILSSNLDVLMDSENNTDALENCIGASLSIKGAAQLVKIQLAIKLSSSMEDAFVFYKQNNIQPDNTQLNYFIEACEYLSSLSGLEIKEHESPTKDIINKRNNIIKTIESLTKDNAATQTQDPETPNTEIVDEDSSLPDNIDPMMFDLFKTELENNTIIMSDSLLSVESEPDNEEELERLMRSSHSIKGAARLLGIDSVVKLAHIMEDCFVSAQNNILNINNHHIDLFLQCVDLFKNISDQSVDEYNEWITGNLHIIKELEQQLSSIEQHQEQFIEKI